MIDDDRKVRLSITFFYLFLPHDSISHGKPTLRIGHHLLEGKVVSLPKPLAVLQRMCAPLPPTLEGDPDGDGDRDGDGDMQHGDNCNASEDK